MKLFDPTAVPVFIMSLYIRQAIKGFAKNKVIRTATKRTETRG